MNTSFPWRLLLSRLNAVALLYLGLAPVYLLLGAALAPEQQVAAMLLPLLAVGLTCGAGCVRGKRRRSLFALAVALTAAVYACVFLPVQAIRLLTFLPALLSMLLLMPAMARPAREEWAVSQIGVGIAVYLVGLIIARQAIFTEINRILPWLFSAYIILSVFYVNSLSLMSVAGVGKAGGILPYNRRLLVLCCAVAIPVANFDAVWSALENAALWLAHVALTVMRFISSLFQSSSSQVEEAASDESMEGLITEGAEPSAFALFMEKVAMVLAIVLITALVIFVAYQIGKKLRKWFGKVWERLQAYTKKIGDSYEDSAERIPVWGDVQNAAREKWEQYKRRANLTPWSKLTPRDTVRRIYALLLLRTREVNPTQTAKETLTGDHLGLQEETAAELAALYDEARYSDHPLSMEQAQAIRKKAGV